MNNKLIPVVLTLVVGIILAGSVLVPVLNDAKEDLGNPATLTNTSNNKVPLKYWEGEEIVYAFDNTNKVFTRDGENVTWYSNQLIFTTSDFSLWSRAATNDYKLAILGDTSDVHNSFTVTISADGSCTILRGSTTVYEGVLTWAVYQDPDGTANLVEHQGGSYLTGVKDNLIILGNLYTTGENDTYYSYYNGVLTVGEEYADNSSVSITSTLKEGYTDIYTNDVSVIIGEESFTPYYIVIPATVSGHEAAGAAYSLLGAIPVIVIVALLVAAIGMIAVRRND